jgi:hypothetical protein
MNRIVVERKVSAEGVLNLTLLIGKDEAGRNMRLTIEPAGLEAKITPEEWKAGIFATAGGWLGEFEEPAPGKLEEREPLS